MLRSQMRRICDRLPQGVALSPMLRRVCDRFFRPLLPSQNVIKIPRLLPLLNRSLDLTCSLCRRTPPTARRPPPTARCPPPTARRPPPAAHRLPHVARHPPPHVARHPPPPAAHSLCAAAHRVGS
ncbi:Lipase [Canna indica]|uniref:Lipase n=1 Tax=Canna indica TaxID=4628 RepID=A0AAQ3Q7F4_9LILI|nr:Lipase [Canna indica]